MKQRLLVSLTTALLLAATSYAQQGTGASGQRQNDWTGQDMLHGTYTPDSILSSGQVKSSSPSAGIGYATGAGAAVTQITTASTGVTINATSGAITTVTQNIAAAGEVQFTVTNSAVAVGDVPVVSVRSGSVGGTTTAHVTVTAAGSFQVTLTNLHASVAETGVLILNFAVIKAVSS